MAQNPTHLEHHVVLQGRRYLIVERLDHLPDLTSLTQLPSDDIGPRDRYDVGAGILLHAPNERRAHTVDDVVGDQGGQYFAAQAVSGQQILVTLAQNRREIALRIHREEVLEAFLRRCQSVVQIDFRVAQNHGDFRAGKALLQSAALLDLGFVRQELDVAIEKAGTLEIDDQSRGFGEALDGPRFHHADGLGLQIVIAQDELGNVVGHLDQQLVAVRSGQATLSFRLAQQDLDVDLAVRAVDARRVVDEVRVDATTVEAVFDAGSLRQPEVAAFTDDFAAQLVSVDPQVVIAAIAGVAVAFRACLDVGTDPAIPQQVDPHAQDCPDELVRLYLRRADIEQLARLG